MSCLHLDRLRSLCAAVLIGAVFFAPFHGFMHRIAHAAVWRDAGTGASAAGAPAPTLHSCAGLDAATLGAATPAQPWRTPLLAGRAAAPPALAHVAPLLPFRVRFRPRAPPPRVDDRLPLNQHQ